MGLALRSATVVLLRSCFLKQNFNQQPHTLPARMRIACCTNCLARVFGGCGSTRTKLHSLEVWRELAAEGR